MNKIIWYDIENDLVFESSYVDAMFYGLQPLHWDKIELLGVL